MPDKYHNFEALRQEKVEHRDYVITVEHEGRSRSVIVIAPHAGKIEPVTSMLAKEIARDDYCLYLFEGIMEGNNFTELHITSINFESREPCESSASAPPPLPFMDDLMRVIPTRSGSGVCMSRWSPALRAS